jgi:predicted RNase H-like HicB family nuclease
MVYYIGVLEGEADNWGVRLYDFDGCVGAGNTAEEALANATEALRDVVAYKRNGGYEISPPSSMADIVASGEIAPHESLVLIPLILDAGRSVRANLTVDAGLLEAVDQAASLAGITRSAYFSSAVRERLIKA